MLFRSGYFTVELFCTNYYLYLTFVGEAVTSPTIRSHYRRQKSMEESVNVLKPLRLKLGDCTANGMPVFMFDVRQILHDRLQHRSIAETYAMDTIPLYARGMKRRYGDQVTTSFLDSTAHAKLLETVPLEERPPILLAVYADEIDRDQTLHSTQKNKYHCTFLRILNETNNGNRSRNDYELAVIANTQAIKEYTYDKCMQKFIQSLNDVVDNGLYLNNKHHAVRLVQIFADGLERSRIYGMKGSFSKVKYIDPHSLVTKDERFNCSPQEFAHLVKTNIRTKASYEEDVRLVEANPFMDDSHGIVKRSIWNAVSFFHVMDSGSVAPCSAHDINGGFAKEDISLILKFIARERGIDWGFLQNGLLNMHCILRFEDKRDLSVRIAGKHYNSLSTILKSYS